MNGRTKAQIQASKPLCRSMYEELKSFVSECYVAVWIPKTQIEPEWLAQFEAHGLHLELRGDEYLFKVVAKCT